MTPGVSSASPKLTNVKPNLIGQLKKTAHTQTKILETQLINAPP